MYFLIKGLALALNKVEFHIYILNVVEHLFLEIKKKSEIKLLVLYHEG